MYSGGSGVGVKESLRPRRAIALWVLSLIAVGLGVWASMTFMIVASRVPAVVGLCEGRLGLQTFAGPSQPGYRECVEDSAKRFLTYDYAESKDASKAFLTLLTALFVASITFSEKIVDVQKSSWWSLGFMVACWVLLLAAIACCGAALALMMIAAGYAAYNPNLSYWGLENKAVGLYVGAGLAFGGSLVALLVAGIISLVERRSQT
jgi:hypothetical protein